VALAGAMIKIQNDVIGVEDHRAAYLMDGKHIHLFKMLYPETLISAWSTICRVMGTDFAPFMRYVVPPLLEAAAWKPTPSKPPRMWTNQAICM
jgi:hypothetical protein